MQKCKPKYSQQIFITNNNLKIVFWIEKMVNEKLMQLKIELFSNKKLCRLNNKFKRTQKTKKLKFFWHSLKNNIDYHEEFFWYEIYFKNLTFVKKNGGYYHSTSLTVVLTHPLL